METIIGISIAAILLVLAKLLNDPQTKTTLGLFGYGFLFSTVVHVVISGILTLIKMYV